MTEQCQKLNPSEREIPLNILNKFEDLFDGTLGTWNTAQVDLKLKDDAKPVVSRPYTVLRVHKAMFRKEVKIIVKLGVTEEANDLEWGAHSFAQPKAKDN